MIIALVAIIVIPSSKTHHQFIIIGIIGIKMMIIIEILMIIIMIIMIIIIIIEILISLISSERILPARAPSESSDDRITPASCITWW